MNDLVLIEKLEAAMLQQPQVECPVIHRFGPGLYIREVSIPAGTFAIGHRQKTRHQNVMLRGRVTVLNANGSTSELVAPLMFVGEPGRKVGFVHEDMVWLNIYATQETDVEKLEAAFIEKSQTWEELATLPNAVALLKSDIDRKDFDQVLLEHGVSRDLALAHSQDEADQIPFPEGGYKVMVAASSIDGRGLFATAAIQPGEVIAPARIGGMRTPAGRYTNHSATPNARMELRADGDIDLVATHCIVGCTGGLKGQEITIDYRQALALSIEKTGSSPCQQ